jgi:16S rRNA (cytosine1402-N4)-methyltransferase
MLSRTDNIMESIHKTVLLQESVDGLNLAGKNGVVVDGTFGGGGHSLLICQTFPNIRVIALDQDMSAWGKALHKFQDQNYNITFVNSNFRNLDKVLETQGVKNIDGIILDLGLSSDQLENSGRGFSFMKDEPLYMTMKDNPKEEDVTAYDVVNTWSEENLANIIYGYGGEHFSRRIAKGIVDARHQKKLETTNDLVRVIEASVPAKYKNGRIHCATKTFQAIRIAVNDELGALGDVLEKGFDALSTGGRMSIISFHSLEDRIVKRFFKNKVDRDEGILINKKPIIPSKEEIKNNSRSRSAKLRVIEKI